MFQEIVTVKPVGVFVLHSKVGARQLQCLASQGVSHVKPVWWWHRIWLRNQRAAEDEVLQRGNVAKRVLDHSLHLVQQYYFIAPSWSMLSEVIQMGQFILRLTHSNSYNSLWPVLFTSDDLIALV